MSSLTSEKNPYVRSMSVTSYGGIDDPETGRNLTGSMHVATFTYKEDVQRKVCIDMGGHQGVEGATELNSQVEVIPDAVVITHAHLDHIGRLVVLWLLWKSLDLPGKIYMSFLTKLIGTEALLDSARISMKLFDKLNNRHITRLESLKEALKISNEVTANHPAKDTSKQTKFKKGRDRFGNNMNVTDTSSRSSTKQSTNPSKQKMTPQMAEVILGGYGISCQKDIVLWDIANKPTPPAFKEEDVLVMMDKVIVLPDGEFTDILPGISVRPYNAGHVLGSKSMLFSVQKGPRKKAYAYFSGDLGSYRWLTKPAGEIEVPGKEFPLSFAAVESTYGGTVREDFVFGMEKLESDLAHAAKKKLASVFACFSLDRAQRVLHELQLLQKKNEWNFPIYLDSPLSATYTALYAEHAEDEAFRESMKNVFVIADKDMRKSLMEHKDFRVIITSSGMAEGGPILAYLSQWLGNEEVEFSFPGYMAENTTGHKLAMRGLKFIELPEEGGGNGGNQQLMGEIIVRAKINHYTHFSGHGDAWDLIHWLSSITWGRNMTCAIGHGVRKGGSQSLLNTMKRKGMKTNNVIIPQLQEEIVVF